MLFYNGEDPATGSALPPELADGLRLTNGEGSDVWEDIEKLAEICALTTSV